MTGVRRVLFRSIGKKDLDNYLRKTHLSQQPKLPNFDPFKGIKNDQIGRASCRERV